MSAKRWEICSRISNQSPAAGLPAERRSGWAAEPRVRRVDDGAAAIPREKLGGDFDEIGTDCDELASQWLDDAGAFGIAEHDDWQMFEAKLATIRRMGEAHVKDAATTA